jgi:glycosyltransferase involved in cell wall biosynthesis
MIENKKEGGKYCNNLIKINYSDSPLISIVTVVYNSEEDIEKTIISVINQSYKNYEYIIIDGCSNDNTISIIKKYDLYIDYWISEKDKGIYDAMNKGVRLSKGDYLIFMNSGDQFYNDTVIHDVFYQITQTDIIYGHWKVNYGNNIIKNAIPEDIKNIERGMYISHQAIFAQRKLLIRYPFDLNYKISADYDFLMSCYRNGAHFKLTNVVITIISAGGLSDNNIQSIREHYAICKKYNKKYSLALYYQRKIYIVFIKKMIKKILPKCIIDFVIKQQSHLTMKKPDSFIL